MESTTSDWDSCAGTPPEGQSLLDTAIEASISPLASTPPPPSTRSRSSSWQLVAGLQSARVPVQKAEDRRHHKEAITPSLHQGGAAEGVGENGSVCEDVLGFALSDTESKAYQRQQSIDRSRKDKLMAQWDTLAQELESTGGIQITISDLKSGVPMKHRKWVWPRICGAYHRRAEHPGLYKALQARAEGGGLPREVVRSIEKDIPRTFAGHRIVHSLNGVSALRRVLCAYALHDPVVGYCQGMNLVAAMLLLVLGASAEEEAFWVLEALVQRSFAGYFEKELENCRLDHQVLCCLLKHHDKELHAHLSSRRPSLDSLFRWQLCLFAGVLPSSTVVRLWDMALAAKGPKVLLRASLAILSLNRTALLLSDGPDQCMAALETSLRCTFDSEPLVNPRSAAAKLSFDQIVEWRGALKAGATELQLPLLMVHGVAESQGTHGSIELTTFELRYHFKLSDADADVQVALLPCNDHSTVGCAAAAAL